MPSSGKIELATHLLEAKLAELLAVYYINRFSMIAEFRDALNECLSRFSSK